MADNTTPPPARLRSSSLLSAVAIGAIGAVTASGLTVPAAYADPAYPSWEDVQKAKQNEAAKKAEIAKIEDLLSGLETAAADASREAQIAAEAFRITQDELDAITAKEESLTRQAETAKKAAETSKMRAGLIAAHLAKTGAQDISLNMFLNSGSADDFLHELGTASKLSEQSETIYRQAIQDKNTAASLAEQAASAKKERKRLSELSKSRFDDANDAAQSAMTAFETEQRKSSELFEQLAALKNTTAEAERQYRASQQAATPAPGLPAAPVTPGGPGNQPAPAPAPPAPNPPATGQPAPPAPAPAPPAPAPAPPAPAPAPPAPAPAPPAPAPAPPAPAPAPAPSQPDAGVVNIAINFARQQLGDRYELGASGPDAWDCSGLTKAAYAAAGVYIGTHSATNQYYTMKNQGKLVPRSEAKPGDLIFWGSAGNYYHVALYIGGGQIIEAPNPTRPVRQYYIWSPGEVAPYVGRPTG